MRFLVLGPLRVVSSSGADVTPRGRRTLDVLAVLLLRRRQAVDAQVLLELVWGDEAVGLDVSAVHTVVARLRRGLGEPVVETTSRGYRLTGDVAVDADEFTAAVTRARGGVEGGGARGAAAVAAYDEALALWRPGVAWDGADDELVASERSRLTALRDSTREALAEALLDTGEPTAAERALATAQELVEADPLRERGHELLMRARMRLGRQAEALGGFRTLQELLRDELGIDPGPAATDLHARMLAQDPSLLAPAVATSGARSRPAPAAPLTALVGRDSELAELLTAVRERRLVTVTGPGGVGKSRLLAEAFHRAGRDEPMAYVDLAERDSPTARDLVDAVAVAFGVRLPTDLPPVDALADALTTQVLGDVATPDGHATLFIDEAERAQDATVAVLAALLPACPGLHVCVTSRRALDLAGQRNLELRPLACPPPGAPPEQVRASPAVRLLHDRLLDRTPGLELGPEDVVRLGRLAREVDGLPLALELLARKASTRSLAELGQAARRPLDLTGEQDRPDRHRSLRDTLLWSADALDPEHRRVLRHIGVFRGEFGADAAGAVVPRGDDVPGALRTLVRDALVQVSRRPDGLRVRLLRTVRDLALEGLEETGALAATRARHRRWYADRWRGAPRSDELLLDVHASYADFVEALRTALEDDDQDTVADLAIALARFWAYTDMVGTGVRWLGEVLDSGLPGELERAHVLVMRAVLTLHADPDGSCADLEEALPALEAAGDETWLLTVQNNLSLQRLARSELDGALTAARHAVRLAGDLGDPREADTTSVLALVQALHRPDEAPASVARAWRLAVDSGSLATLSSVANNLFLAQAQLGEWERARALLATVEELVPADHVPLFLLLVQGWDALHAGDPHTALARFGKVARASRDAVSDSRAVEVYAGAGCALAALGHPDAAPVVTGALELGARVGSSVVPWQRALLEQARAGLDGLVPAQRLPEPARVLGSRLSDLVVAADRELAHPM
ncbi:MAG: BTAD domain-containing putative transcriptional regulator [Nocardioidaceae bacterium]